MVCAGCNQDKPLKAKGLCNACYVHAKKYGTTERHRMKREGCTIEGCDNPAHGRGLCQMHLKRLRTTGSTDDPRLNKPDPKTHHPLYPQWIDFQRKENARPVVQEWKDSFEAFLAGVGTRPSPRHRLYRLDTTKPFGPDNFEWRLALVQKLPGETAQEYNTRYHRAHREAYGHDYRNNELKRKYGVTKREVVAMAEEQQHCCAVCGEPEKEMRNGLLRHLAVDHDHGTGAIRGLLCQSCNTGLGKFRDDTTLLARAIAYLAKHKDAS